MEPLAKYIKDERTGLEYELCGDYYIITGEDEPEREPIGVWGQRHLNYIQKHCKPFYNKMLNEHTLYDYLLQLNHDAEDTFNRLVMNIAYAEYKGVPFSYISKTGVVSPDHYDEPDFLRSFEGGLLTTCGITYMGAPCVDEGIKLGAHGRISNIPAYDVCISQDWDENDEYCIIVSGKVRESSMFGENMVLKRTIKTYLGSDSFTIHDEVVNEGFTKTPFMILYHMNFGYPLLSEDAKLTTNCENLRPRDDAAKPGVNDTYEFSAPIADYAEQVFYRDSVKQSYAELKNDKLGIACRIEFDGEQLPYLVEWKQVGKKEYVVGLEPGTNPPDGRDKIRNRGELIELEPYEKREFDLKISLK